MINPVDSAAIAPTLAYAASKHIPVVSVDVAPTKGNVYMIVRADNVLYGQNACKYIGSHVSGSGHVAMLEGDLASINGLDRKNGFLNCMKANYPKLKVVEYATKWDTPTAVNDAKTALSAYSDLKAIYVHWSGPVPGIIAAEKAAGKFTQGRHAGPHRPLQRRRDAAGARLDPRRRGGRHDLAAGQPLRAASPSTTRSRRSNGAKYKRRHDDGSRQQDREPARQPRGRDRRARRDARPTSTIPNLWGNYKQVSARTESGRLRRGRPPRRRRRSRSPSGRRRRSRTSPSPCCPASATRSSGATGPASPRSSGS